MEDLPDDVLKRIFGFCFDIRADRLLQNFPVPLLVCKRWLQCIKQVVSAIRLSLCLKGPAPLRSLPRHFHRNDMDFASWLHQFPNLRALEIAAPLMAPSWDAFFEALARNCPSLEELYVVHTRNARVTGNLLNNSQGTPLLTGREFNLLSTCLPKVRVLSLSLALLHNGLPRQLSHWTSLEILTLAEPPINISPLGGVTYLQDFVFGTSLELTPLRGLASVHTLSMQSPYFDLSPLLSMPCLRRLRIEDPVLGMSDEDLVVIGGLVGLECLQLDSVNSLKFFDHDDEGLTLDVSRLGKLKELNVGVNISWIVGLARTPLLHVLGLGTDTSLLLVEENVRDIQQMPSLRTLQACVDSRALASIHGCTQLEKLGLGFGVEAVAMSGQLPCARDLSLNFNYGMEESEYLPPFSRPKVVKNLTLVNWNGSNGHYLNTLDNLEALVIYENYEKTYPGLQLVKLPPLEASLSSLKRLVIHSAYKLQNLPELHALSSLRELFVWDCWSLTTINSLPPSLETLDISRSGISSLPCLSHLVGLQLMVLSSCSELTQLPSLSNLHSLQRLDITGTLLESPVCLPEGLTADLYHVPTGIYRRLA